MDIPTSIIQDFKKSEAIYKKFSSKIDSLIKELLSENKINPHQIVCRVKEERSLSDKVSRKRININYCQKLQT